VVDYDRMSKRELAREINALRSELDDLRKAAEKDPGTREFARLEQVKVRFTERVTHELRTPLTPLKSAIEIMLDETAGEITPEQKKYLEMMRRNVDRLEHFVDDITSLSGLESGHTVFEPRRLSVLSVARGVVDLLRNKAEKRGIEISMGTQTELLVWADQDALATVISNLVDNAIMHNPEGTTVRISTRLTGKDSVEVAVRDDGRGIEPHLLDIIFDRFSGLCAGRSPKHAGAGVGLSVCKRLVEMMGGEIHVESVPAKGTVFRFTLPAKPATAPVDSQ
jgi:signal transduction histidine kinase